VQKLDEETAKAICEKLTSCCNKADYESYFGQFKDVPFTLKGQPTPDAGKCVEVLTNQWFTFHGKWMGGVARGTMKYDDARGKACVAKLKAATCGVSLTEALYDEKCFDLRRTEVFTKIAPLGAACKDIADSTFYGECNPATGYCGSAGKCEAWHKTGEACGIVPTRMFCEPGLGCNGGSGAEPGKCSAKPTPGKLGDVCYDLTKASDVECPEGTFCDFLGTRKCEAKKPDGADCSGDDECISTRPYSCYPFGGNGKCGQTSYCGGR
jgi:hypothetical protein